MHYPCTRSDAARRRNAGGTLARVETGGGGAATAASAVYGRGMAKLARRSGVEAKRGEVWLVGAGLMLG